MTLKEAHRAWTDRTPVAHVPGGRAAARRVGVLAGAPTWDNALKVHLVCFDAGGKAWCSPLYDLRVATADDLLAHAQ